MKRQKELKRKQKAQEKMARRHGKRKQETEKTPGYPDWFIPTV
ncbi:MAG: hypothetical protein PHN82_00655 [bacterium]|nr:hypothetical protein [bacterium]